MLPAAGPSVAPQARRGAYVFPSADAAAMAPLLGRKPFPLVKPLPGEEPLFTIAHTQEAFRTREYPFPAALARPPAGWGGAGWAAQPRASGSCQRARRRRACTRSLSPEPAVPGAGGPAGRPGSGRSGALCPPSFPGPRILSTGLAVGERSSNQFPRGLVLGPN